MSVSKRRNIKQPITKAIHACNLWQSAAQWQGNAYEAMFAFATALGDPYVAGRTLIINTDNPEVVRKIDLILSPHGATILKMMIIKNTPDKESD